MKIYRDIVQGSEPWLAIRKGRPTASRFDEIVTATGTLSKQSTAYMRELIAECFCPDFASWGGNAMTERGTELEPLARESFATHTGLTPEQVGFVISEDGICGCSPDSFLMRNGEPFAGLEIKCPSPKAHVGYVLDGILPACYMAQVHGSMVVTGLSQWHFFSHFPGMKPLHVLVMRDTYTARVEEAVSEFVKRYKTAMEIAVPKLKLNPTT